MKKQVAILLISISLLLTLAGCKSAEPDTLSFSEFKDLSFICSSGAGGWGTTLTIAEDGSFSGEYHDNEYTSTGEEYPDGTIYQCVFAGKFTQPVKVNDYTYSMQIQEISMEKEPETKEIIDGILHCYVRPYNLEGAENILIYMPGSPVAELPEEFRSWVGFYDLSSREETELHFMGLYNETEQAGFRSNTIFIE